MCHGGKCARFFCDRFADFLRSVCGFLRSVCGFFALGLRIFCARFADFFGLGLRIFCARFADFLRSVCGFFALGLQIFCARFEGCLLHGLDDITHGPPSLGLSRMNYLYKIAACNGCEGIPHHWCMHRAGLQQPNPQTERKKSANRAQKSANGRNFFFCSICCPDVYHSWCLGAAILSILSSSWFETLVHRICLKTTLYRNWAWSSADSTKTLDDQIQALSIHAWTWSNLKIPHL